MLSFVKNLFRPPEAKASRTARLIELNGGGRARWTPRDFAALAREGYLKNAIVHRSVRLVAESAASLTLLVYDGANALDHHPLLDLLGRPNPRQDQAALLEAVYSALLLAGNGYIEAVSVDGSPRELYALRADRMRVVPGPDGWPEAYEYTVGGSSVRFDQTAALPPILHLAFYHPLDDHYGLSALEAAAVAVDSTNPFSAVLNNALWAAKTVAAGGTGDLRYKMSKEAAANTLSLLLQDNYSGRAEIGLAGDDDLHVKVSADGSTWVEALVVDRTSGKLKVAGDVAVNTSKFNVTASSGNTAIAGTLAVADTTDATSTTTGSLKLSGGLGVVKNAYVGGVLNVAGASTLGGNVGITGTLSASGDVAINTNKFNVTASSGNTAIAGTLAVADTTDASSTTTGSGKFAGGVGIAKKLFVGTSLKVGAAVVGTATAAFKQNDDASPAKAVVIERNADDSAIYLGYRNASSAFVITATFGSTGSYQPLILRTSDTDAVTINTDQTVKFAKDVTLHPASSVTPAANGDLMIQATSNTSLTFKYKGSDGTVRSASLTLS